MTTTHKPEKLVGGWFASKPLHLLFKPIMCPHFVVLLKFHFKKYLNFIINFIIELKKSAILFIFKKKKGLIFKLLLFY